MGVKAEAEYVFEASWEVCNKVGGIYTVVSSKAAQMINQYKDKYFLIGPYYPEKAYGIFEETLPPPELKEIFDELSKEGIVGHFGTWLIKGNPQTILIDFTNYASQANAIKGDLWNAFQIDSLGAQFHDFDEPLVWATAVGKIIEKFAQKHEGSKIVGHFHEWLAGGALLYLKQHGSSAKTVFTTHATMLGRTIASSGTDLYAVLDTVNPEEEARKHGIQSKWTMEKQCAQNADCFTTVSEITGLEAEKLLGRKPDVYVYNGLDMAKFPTFEDLSIKHNLYKAKIKDFLLYYFFPYYSFDIDNTLIYFLCGRYEFHDKGIDVFIQALSILNDRLKKDKSPKTIVAFFWVPGNIKGIKQELLASKTYYQDIRDSISDNINEIRHNLTHALISGKKISDVNLFPKDFVDELKPKIIRLKRKGSPPLSTHDLHDWDTDPIIQSFMRFGLNNGKDDRVKVVFYPIYLTGADGLLDTSYYESMMGSHLGVFPSYYEPWGYTPLEGGALGIPSITTDLAGFGRFIQQEKISSPNPGIWVIDRLNKEYQQVVDDLADTLYYYATRTKQDRIQNKIAARTAAGKADWQKFIEHYVEAHNLALTK